MMKYNSLCKVPAKLLQLSDLNFAGLQTYDPPLCFIHTTAFCIRMRYTNSYDCNLWKYVIEYLCKRKSNCRETTFSLEVNYLEYFLIH